MTRLRSTLAFLILMTASQISYGEEIYPCDASCSGLFSAARQLATSLPDGTMFSLIDVKTWEIGTYVVEHYYRRGEHLERAVQVTTSNNVISAANQLRYAEAAVRSLVIYIPPEVADDAHSAVISVQKEDQVGAYVASHLDVMATVGALGAAVLQVFGRIVNIEGIIDVVFPDGSTAKFVLRSISQDRKGEWEFQFELLEGSAKDADGNNIPTSGAEVAGERQFTSEQHMERMADVLDLYGPRFEFGNCRQATAITCVLGPGGIYDCTKFTLCL